MLTNQEITAVKGRGFLRNRGTECFSGRLVGKGGVFTADQLAAAAECARLFGDGTAIMTARLAIEITGIPYEKIPEAEKFIHEKTGLSFGGTGAKVRPIVACKGTTCVYGNIDTRALAAEIHDRFYIGMADVKLPHKFKIAVGGCPNSCMKPSLNDFGIEGLRRVEYDIDKCRGCKVCQIEAGCPMKACRVENGKLSVDKDLCNNCGVCVGKCPFGAVKKEAPAMYRVHVGGTWGKRVRIGTPLSRFVEKDELMGLIERAIYWFRDNGQPKERLGMTINRLGIEAFEKAVLS